MNELLLTPAAATPPTARFGAADASGSSTTSTTAFDQILTTALDRGAADGAARTGSGADRATDRAADRTADRRSAERDEAADRADDADRAADRADTDRTETDRAETDRADDAADRTDDGGDRDGEETDGDAEATDADGTDPAAEGETGEGEDGAEVAVTVDPALVPITTTDTETADGGPSRLVEGQTDNGADEATGSDVTAEVARDVGAAGDVDTTDLSGEPPATTTVAAGDVTRAGTDADETGDVGDAGDAIAGDGAPRAITRTDDGATDDAEGGAPEADGESIATSELAPAGDGATPDDRADDGDTPADQAPTSAIGSGDQTADADGGGAPTTTTTRVDGVSATPTDAARPTSAIAEPAAASTTAEAAATLATTAGGDTDETALVRQVQRALSNIRLNARGEQTFTIRLHPEELGSVTIKVTTTDAAVRVGLVTDTAAAAGALANQRTQLVQELAESGLDGASVDVAHGDASSAGERQGDGDGDDTDQAGGGDRALAGFTRAERRSFRPGTTAATTIDLDL